MAGYHINTIAKGELGEYSKVIEEFMEFQDSVHQDCSIMALVELSDLLCALKFYFYSHDQKLLWENTISHLFNEQFHLPVDYADLEEVFELTLTLEHVNHWDRVVAFMSEIHQYVHTYNLTIRDLIRMSYVTERAFSSGQRT